MVVGWRLPGGRRRVGWLVAAVAAALALLWWLLPYGGEAAPGGHVVFATGVPTGVYEDYGQLLKKDLHQDDPALHVRLEHSQGSPDNIARVATGRAQFAIATTDAVAAYLARHGPGAHRLRACARLYDDYIQLIVPKGSTIRSVRDLRHLRVGVGEGESGVQLVTRRLVEAAGMHWGTDFRPVSVGIDRMPGLLRSGKLDAFFWSGGLPTLAVRTLADAQPVRLVQLGDLIDPLHREGDLSRYYRAATVPTDAYPAMHLDRPVSTVAVPNVLLTTDRVSAAVAETVTRTVIKSRDEIGAVVHAAQKVDLRTAVFTDPLPLHEGATRYYRSVKP